MNEDILEQPEQDVRYTRTSGRLILICAASMLVLGGVGYAIGRRASPKNGGAVGAVVGAGAGLFVGRLVPLAMVSGLMWRGMWSNY